MEWRQGNAAEERQRQNECFVEKQICTETSNTANFLMQRESVKCACRASQTQGHSRTCRSNLDAIQLSFKPSAGHHYDSMKDLKL
eukprot:437507-Amphidinium_carterae.1